MPETQEISRIEEKAAALFASEPAKAATPAAAGKLAVLHGRRLAGEAVRAFKKDAVLAVSAILAIASSFWTRPDFSGIDFGVLTCLFNIMVVVKALEELNLLDKFSIGILNKCKSTGRISLVLVLLPFFSSMLLTNDVALLTMVPLAVITGKKSGIDMKRVVILQTLAANIGSSLTPMGNPQNLYIFSFYKLEAWQFFKVSFIFPLCGLAWLLVLIAARKSTKVEVSLNNVKTGGASAILVWTSVFAVIILSVFHIIGYEVAFAATAAAAAAINRKLLAKVDFRLLLTFICFFIFTGNMAKMASVSEIMGRLLYSGTHTYLSSILASQVISNVPCAILFSAFTPHWKELLLGVNIGGIGTLVASLASVISYRLYIAENPGKAGSYILSFSIYNAAGLILFTALNLFVSGLI